MYPQQLTLYTLWEYPCLCNFLKSSSNQIQEYVASHYTTCPESLISLTWWVPFPLSHNAEHSSNYFIFSSLSSQTPPYSVPLDIAATAGHTQCVERLLKGGAHINYQRQVCNNIIMT